ncbi:IF2 family translation initiation factor [Mycobacterium sp. MMS18-G62]
MNITDIPFAVLRFQYQLARFPLQLIEDRVVARMDSEAPARLFYERSLGLLDATVGNALGAPELEQRGAALVERSDELRRAARLDAAATENIKQADANVKVTREKAAEESEEAHAEAEREVQAAREEAQDRKRAAVESAEKRIGAVREQADDVAARRTSAVEVAKREEEAQIRAAERTVTTAADAQLKDAQEKRSEAAAKRAQADRIEELADEV